MQLLDSIVEGALKLPDRADADALIAAVVRFMACGEEPEGLGPVADAMWTAMRPVVANSRARAEAGRSGGSRPAPDADGADVSKPASKPASKTPSKPASKPASKTPSKPASKTPSKTPSKPASKTPSKTPSYQDSYSYSSSQSSSGEGVQGEGCAFEPPTLDEVRAYFGANMLRGDPEDFFLHFEAQGWVNGNGQAIANWQARALKWSRDQVSRDVERLARGEPAPEQAVWRPAQETDPEEDLRRAEEEFRRKYGGDGA